MEKKKIKEKLEKPLNKYKNGYNAKKRQSKNIY